MKGNHNNDNEKQKKCDRSLRASDREKEGLPLQEKTVSIKELHHVRQKANANADRPI